MDGHTLGIGEKMGSRVLVSLPSTYPHRQRPLVQSRQSYNKPNPIIIGFMAKSDSFFIRADVTTTNGAFTQSEIDLGAYVDALGKSVLRIHNIQLQFQSAQTAARPPQYAGPNGAEVTWQLTTQTQSSMSYASDKAVIASGMLQLAEQLSSGGDLSTDMPGPNVQHWTNGYLVGVEQIYLGGQQTAIAADTVVSVILECTVETLTQNAAMALALSQQ